MHILKPNSLKHYMILCIICAAVNRGLNTIMETASNFSSVYLAGAAFIAIGFCVIFAQFNYANSLNARGYGVGSGVVWLLLIISVINVASVAVQILNLTSKYGLGA